MTDERLGELVRTAIPPTDDDAARDLWPAVIGRIDQRTRWSALDLGLAAAATAALLVFPEWLFLLLYHL